MKLRLDKDKCVGHAQCYAVNPELFPIDDGGYSIVEDRDVGDGESDDVRAGVDACPERALVLED